MLRGRGHDSLVEEVLSITFGEVPVIQLMLLALHQQQRPLPAESSCQFSGFL